MFAKRLLQKAVHHSQLNVKRGHLKPEDLDLRIAIHYGIPLTSSILAFDSVQRLLAVGTLDGRIKVIGGDGIEGLLISPQQLPYKYLEFIQNQGFLVGISNDDSIQIWNLETRCLVCSQQWESNITAFAVISGSFFLYVGDEYGLLSVLKYDSEQGKLLQFPYNLPANYLSEAAGFPLPDHQPVVGILPQPRSSGSRVVIAYETGLIILWDVSEAQVVFVGGGRDLQLKDSVDVFPDDTSEHHLEEKEISAVCWASSDGSILAVGYVDGDVLFWNTSTISSSKDGSKRQNNNVVKLQLSSAEKRLPVIVLHWSKNDKASNGYDSRLFIYGGDEIGSEEVLTILSLEWTSGMETLRCIGRVDLTLAGSFADMILLPSAGQTRGNHKADLLVLTNPGQLHIFNDSSLSTTLSQKERKTSINPVEFPWVIPTYNPSMTVAEFVVLPKSSKGLSELASLMKLGSNMAPAGGMKSPLTGGVPSQISVSEGNRIHSVYVAGYQDGSVWIWNASYAVLKLISILEGEVQGINISGLNAPVSSLKFCSVTFTLAVGNECGMVRIYNLDGSSDKTGFHYVTETIHEVHNPASGKGPPYKAVFSLFSSPVRSLQFKNCGARLAVGFQCGRVAVLDVNSSSILFSTDCESINGSPVISMSWLEFKNDCSLLKSSKHQEQEGTIPVQEILFVLTQDAKISPIDCSTGNMISSRPWHLKREETAISMYVVDSNTCASGLTSERQKEQPREDIISKSEPQPQTSSVQTNEHGITDVSSAETTCSGENSNDAFVLLCCENSLRLYSMKSVIQGNDKAICKVKHGKPCCWTTTFKKHGEVCGLLLLFQTGIIEVRSFPDLELVKESSIMSTLRWNFKANMEKTMSSDNDNITLANGCEVAFISLLASENDFRIPESLPCLHDRVLAAAADAAFSFSSSQKKKQVTAPRILGSIAKGFKVEKTNIPPRHASNITHLEHVFLKSSFAETSTRNVKNDEEAVELNIDDIEIDDVPPAISHEVVKTKGGKETDRERLLGPPDDTTKPRIRTPQEIMAKYRKAEDASSAAAHARNKLVERQEKLEKISRRTAELQSGAEDFASLADELVKTMENRKWWHI